MATLCSNSTRERLLGRKKNIEIRDAHWVQGRTWQATKLPNLAQFPTGSGDSLSCPFAMYVWFCPSLSSLQLLALMTMSSLWSRCVWEFLGWHFTVAFRSSWIGSKLQKIEQEMGQAFRRATGRTRPTSHLDQPSATHTRPAGERKIDAAPKPTGHGSLDPGINPYLQFLVSFLMDSWSFLFGVCVMNSWEMMEVCKRKIPNWYIYSFYSSSIVLEWRN